MSKVRNGLVYGGIIVVWIGGFFLAAKGGEYIGQGVGRACAKATEKLCEHLA